MAEAQQTVLLSGVPLTYTLERKNVKNLNLRIYPDGSVRVSANRRVPVREIEAFLIGREDFIRKAQGKFQARPQEKPLEYVTGETIRYLGQKLELRVVPAERDRAYIQDGQLILELRRPAGAAAEPVLGQGVRFAFSGNPSGMLSYVSGIGGGLPHPSDSVDEVPVGFLPADQGDHYSE